MQLIVISKKFRLKQREVKKVLQRGKPFFSYGIVLNYTKNKLSNNRFAIVIWWKSVITNVQRTSFRRKFYDLMREYIDIKNNDSYYDFIFVVKKQTKLNGRDVDSVQSFQKDIQFLIWKVFNKK